MNRTKATLLATGAVLLAVLPIPAAASRSGGKSDQVSLKNIAISPEVVRIGRGGSVTWTWRDKPLMSSHNVTSVGKLRFHSSPTKETGTYTVRFSKPGVYNYHCTIHPLSMHGKIIVR